MKKMMMVAMMMVMTISANAMSYTAARNEALFLSDKMAYELNLTPAQYEAVYEINLDYLMSLNGHADVFGIWWDRRNMDLKFVLTAWQYDKYMSLTYFYHPVAWKAGNWTFTIYSHYNRGYFFNAHPTVYVTYKGGNNHKHDRFYADRHVEKPTNVHYGNQTVKNNHKPDVHYGSQTVNNNHKPVVNNNRSFGNNGHANVMNNSGSHGTTNRQIAQATNNNASSKFGARR